MIASVNPATGELVREFPAEGAAAVELGITQAQAAHIELRGTTFAQRAQWMCQAADLLEADIYELSRVMTLEMGKPIGQARSEVFKCARTMRFYAEHAEAFLADIRLDDPTSVNATQAYATYQPLGSILAIMPWNYPIWQAIRFAAPALMAGNTGLLKHASNVPQTACYLNTLFDRAGFPTGSLRTLLISSNQVAHVLRDPRVKACTLTGSEAAGRSVAATAGDAIKPSVLELGGSDPFIVLPSADLPKAAEVAVTARMQNNGQSCVAAKRFIVHTEVYDEFVRLFTQRVEALTIGDPMDESVDLGPLATKATRDDLATLVDDAIAKGATVLTGGAAIEGPGWFYQPTVLADLHPDMRIVDGEAFGPVAALYRVTDCAEAVRIANQTRFGLSSAVWTTDLDEQEYCVRELEVGAVFVNGMTASAPELPFGGTKSSGFGRELAKEGIRAFTNLKTVWKS